jgi:hypothetical protein
MLTPFIVALVLVLAFGGYLYLCRLEQTRGQRIILATFRGYLDNLIIGLVTKIEKWIKYLIKYVITLSWYYSFHAFLKLSLRSIAGVYYLVESILIKNREKARALRKEHQAVKASHLTKIADHKMATKLTAKEEKKRRDKALKGD